jgi:5-methyltetrahydrofolate--homocysteine methyltransferase
VAAELIGRDPGRPMPDVPLLCQRTCDQLAIPAEAVVDRIDWELSRRVYLGDAYPSFNMDCFGPGVVAAMLGAKLDNSSGAVWFYPPIDQPITDIHLEYDADNLWLRRIKEICAAMMNRWQGQVLVSMTDLGGCMDILSTFRPAEHLLLDLYDHPEDVQRVVGEIHELWHRLYREIDAVLQPVNPGRSAWCGIYSDAPYYILQCDFSYMISPEMFNQFALPELDASTRRLARSFYHLDGKGQLPHLDALLSLPHLNGVQWIPGSGAPEAPRWPNLFEHILAAGKKAQVIGKLDETFAMLQRTGLGAGVHCRTDVRDVSEERAVRQWIDRLASADFRAFGVESPGASRVFISN